LIEVVFWWQSKVFWGCAECKEGAQARKTGTSTHFVEEKRSLKIGICGTFGEFDTDFMGCASVLFWFG
jgi:hypothetical protein